MMRSYYTLKQESIDKILVYYYLLKSIIFAYFLFMSLTLGRTCHTRHQRLDFKINFVWFKEFINFVNAFDAINELFDLEWVDTWVWENPSIFIILSV